MSNYKKCLSEIPHIEEVSWKFPHCTENEHGLDTLEHVQSHSFFVFYPTSQQHPADWGFLLSVPNILFFPNSQSTVFWWLLSFCKNIYPSGLLVSFTIIYYRTVRSPASRIHDIIGPADPIFILCNPNFSSCSVSTGLYVLFHAYFP